MITNITTLYLAAAKSNRSEAVNRSDNGVRSNQLVCYAPQHSRLFCTQTIPAFQGALQDKINNCKQLCISTQYEHIQVRLNRFSHYVKILPHLTLMGPQECILSDAVCNIKSQLAQNE